jgi:Tol biopolymer transport system component
MAFPLPLLLLCSPTVDAQQFVTHRTSLDSAGQEAVGASLNPSVSDNGRHLAFQSTAALAPLASGFTDVYVRDRVDGTTTLISVGGGGVPANSFSSDAHISATGRFVAFSSSASNLVSGDTNGFDDIFLVDRDPDVNGVFDEGNSTTQRVSVTTGGAEANGPCTSPAIAADGSWVCFASLANNLVVSDTNSAGDVFAWSRADGSIRMISLDSAGGQGAGSSGVSAVSQNGRFVAFESLAANLVGADSNGVRDIFLRDRDPDLDGFYDDLNSTTIRVSVSNAGAQANAACNTPDISDSGQVIAFQSAATNLTAGATNGIAQVFARVLTGSRTELLSRAQGGLPGDGASAFPAVSADGTVVAFESRATNLVAGDTNGWDDVFRVDLVNIALTRASLSVPGTQSALYSQRPSVNHDGTEIAFQSPADDLVALDTNGSFDVFVRSAGSWSPQLLLDPLFRAQTANAKVCNTTPSETVYLAYSVVGIGSGPCPPALGGLCLDILAPRLLSSQAASSLGSANFSASIPASAPLIPVYVQAVIPRGPGGSLSVKSNVVTELVQP